MSETITFPDKAAKPTEDQLTAKLGASIGWWKQIYNFVFEQYPKAVAEWNFPGKKYGWSFRIKDKKRAILYFLPREGSFNVAFVFGDKAMTEIMESDISKSIKTDLSEARKYAEGRGIRIPVLGEETLKDIEKLVVIKLKY